MTTEQAGPRVLYLEGDPCAPKFLGAALRHAGADVRQPDTPSPGDVEDVDVVLLSDWPQDRLEHLQDDLADVVGAGTGLLAFGGWKSFGNGGWHEGVLAGILPVTMEAGDDRRNLFQGAYWRAAMEHPVMHGLDLRRPPVLCGHNRFKARDGADVVLTVDAVEDRARTGRHAEDLTASPFRLVPDGDLLVLGRHGRGRTIAFGTDPAPHWSGGMTDWGTRRLPAPEGEELGDQYVALMGNLVQWAAAK